MSAEGYPDFYRMQPGDIVEIIENLDSPKQVSLCNVKFTVLPGVFPSQAFRSSRLLLETILPLVRHRLLIDMGCGFGLLGLAAMRHGASAAILVDINEQAVANAVINREQLGFTESQVKVIHGDCFDQVPPGHADIITFNPPFHGSEVAEPARPIEYAFYDPSFEVLGKFLAQARRYAHDETLILIAYSNKGDIETAEKLFATHGYIWNLMRLANADAAYDSRIYSLQRK